MHLSGISVRRLAPRAILLTTLIVGALFLFSQAADAITIKMIKGSSVLIDTEGADVSVGQHYYVIVDGRKRALVTIAKVKGTKAFGKIVKGNAENGAELQLATPVGRHGHGDAQSSARNGIFIGGILGLGMDSQTVTPTGTTTSVSMSGMGYSLKGFIDIPVSGNLGVIGRVGVDTFNVTGGTFIDSAGDTVTGSTTVMFASADALMRYSFLEGSWRPYAALGVGLYYPVSQSSNALAAIVPTIGFSGGLGLNIYMSPTSYITILGEYGLFPPSGSVSTDSINILAGLGFRY